MASVTPLFLSCFFSGKYYDLGMEEIEKEMCSAFFKDLGDEVVRINTANGWNVLKPEEWETEVDLAEWEFQPAVHRTNNEDCMGNRYPDDYVAYARHKKTGKFEAGAGLSKEEAEQRLRVSISKNADCYKIPAVLALIGSEVSEALEAFRNRDKANFEEELADVVIRCMDCATGLGLDLGKAIAEKLEKNKARGVKHGGKAL